MKNLMVIFTILFALTAAFSQQDLKERSMMKNKIFYATPDGKIGSTEYWQLQLGNFAVKVDRKYPGLGILPIEGNVNIAFMSGGYLEGNGFGGNPQVKSGKITTEANFAVKRGDKYETIRPDTIDYIFFGATKVKIKGASEEEDLFVHIESPYNTYPADKFVLAVYSMNKQFGELEYLHDVEPVAVSFTQEGAQKAYKANIAEANK